MHQRHPSIAAVLILLGLLTWNPAEAWDLTRPLTDFFPDPIGVTSDPDPKRDQPEAADPTFEDTLIVLVNQERWTNGQLAPYKRVNLLDNSSETHSINMAARDFVMHCDPDTTLEFWQRILAAGYTFSSAAENM